MRRKFRFTDETLRSALRFGEQLLGIRQEETAEDKEPEKQETAPAAAETVPEAPAKAAEAVPEQTGNGQGKSRKKKKQKKAAPEKAPAVPETKEEAPEQPQPVKDQPAPVESAADEKHRVARTDIGLVRSSNQDAVILDEGLCGIADGMGGHNGGEVASGMTRDLIRDLLKDKTPSMELLQRCVQSINRRIYERSLAEPALEGMGTTLTVLWYNEENLFIGHVGDSRAYRLRDGELKQMTEDHSYVAELVRQGLITKEQAECHPMRNIITRAVGTEEGIETDISWHKRHRGDRWLICSDGLYGMVAENELKLLMERQPIGEAADALLKAALDAGGRDNVSLVLFDDEEASA